MSPAVGIEPTEVEVSSRKLGMLYFLWDLAKRFRARSKDSAVYFHGAGSKYSTEFLAAWIHSGTARDKMLDWLPTDMPDEKTHRLYAHESNLHRV